MIMNGFRGSFSSMSGRFRAVVGLGEIRCSVGGGYENVKGMEPTGAMTGAGPGPGAGTTEREPDASLEVAAPGVPVDACGASLDSKDGRKEKWSIAIAAVNVRRGRNGLF